MVRARALAEEIHKETGSRVEVSIGLPAHLFERMLIEMNPRALTNGYLACNYDPLMWGGIKFQVIK